MSHTPNYDAKVKTILDELKPGERTCALLGTKWMMDEAEIEQYKKYNVPPSKYAPLTRMKLLNTWIVIFDMWYNQHAETGEPLVSVIHPGTGFRVLPDKDWFSRDFTSAGRDVDFSRPFFDQLHALSLDVPQSANFNYVQPENSLAFISLGDQNSYFVLACKSKNTFYSMNARDVEDSAEVELGYNITRSYNVLHSRNISNCLFVRESFDCLSSAFLFDCRNCEFCFGATNKRYKKYLWFNEQLSKEEWERRRAEADLSSYAVRQEFERRFKELVASAVWPENWNVQCEDCSGDYIERGTRVREGYYVVAGSRDLDTVCLAYGSPSNDCYLCTALVGASDCYYGVGNAECSRNRFSLTLLTRCIETEFCQSCQDCEYCFGCFGLRKKKFCILNKQYTEREYWSLVDKIKCAMLDAGEYGDCPDARFSTQHWSGCGARAFYDLSKEELLQLGMLDIGVEDEGAEGVPMDPVLIRPTSEIPDRVDDSMAKTVYRDEATGRRFSYLVPELALYRQLGVAAPRTHATHRINELYAELNLAVTDSDTCAKCQTSVHVARNKVYPKRTVYCKACYYRHIEEKG